MKRKAALLTAIQAFFIALFLNTAASKWFNFREFTHEMKIQPFTEAFKQVLIIGLPIVEVLIAILVFWPAWRRSGLWASLALMLAFTIYIILIKVNYYGRIPCSCGGIISGLSWNGHLVFNLVAISLACTGLILSKRKATT